MILSDATADYLEQLQDFELAMEALCLCSWSQAFATSDWLITSGIDPKIFIP